MFYALVADNNPNDLRILSFSLGAFGGVIAVAKRLFACCLAWTKINPNTTLLIIPVYVFAIIQHSVHEV